MKIKTYLYCLLTVLLAACTSPTDEMEEKKRTLTLQVTEDKPTVDVPGMIVHVTETYHYGIYLYDNAYPSPIPPLERYESVQSYQYGNDGETYEIRNHGTVSYNKEMVITENDGEGNRYSYQLSEGSRATTCTFQSPGGAIRRYTFAYNADNYLSKIEETIPDEPGVFSSIELDYSNPLEVQVTENIQGTAPHKATLYFDKEEMNPIGLPIHYLLERHPLILHTAALYGRLLGTPYPYLLTKVVPANNQETHEETTYSYSTEENPNAILLKIVTKSAGVDNLIRKITYTTHQ